MVAVVIPEFALLEVQKERDFAHAFELGQSGFRDTPEAFDAVDVVVALGKLIIAMVDAEMLVIAHIDETVVAFEAIGVDHAVQGDFASDNRLQRRFGAVWNDLGINSTMPFNETKHDGFSIGTSTTFTFDPACTKEGFVHFDLAGHGGFEFAMLGNTLANRFEIAVHSVPVKATELGNLGGIQIRRNTRTDSRNLASLIFERFTYLFLIDITKG